MRDMECNVTVIYIVLKGKKGPHNGHLSGCHRTRGAVKILFPKVVLNWSPANSGLLESFLGSTFKNFPFEIDLVK